MPAESNSYVPFLKAYTCFSLDASRLGLENLRRLRELQLKAGTAAIEAMQKASAAITDADDLTTLLSLQPQLFGDRVGQVPQYWREFLQMAKDNQAAILEGFRKATDNCVSGCADAFDQMAKAQPDTAPMDVWVKGLTNAAAFTVGAMTATTQGLNKMVEVGADVPPPARGQTAAGGAPKHH